MALMNNFMKEVLRYYPPGTSVEEHCAEQYPLSYIGSAEFSATGDSRPRNRQRQNPEGYITDVSTSGTTVQSCCMG